MNIVFILAHEFYRDRSPKFLFDMFTFYQNNSINNITIIWTDHFSKFNKEKIIDMKPDIIIFGDIDNIRHGNQFNYIFDLGVHVSCICVDFFLFKRL